ncbi:hypothetical protein GCM10023091_09840 [Ravibacter arvi]|uniref:Uncharacterized protein n=1 Tax=Ravibacter arvi TaxID=2051041 RepID=A0ABP8LSW2_9BACT
MSYEEFLGTLSDTVPPEFSNEILRALWYEARGDWEQAHEIAQEKEGTKAYDRLHAYLHRVEGDEWNAGYWYRRSGAPMPGVPFKEEWAELVKTHL